MAAGLFGVACCIVLWVLIGLVSSIIGYFYIWYKGYDLYKDIFRHLFLACIGGIITGMMIYDTYAIFLRLIKSTEYQEAQKGREVFIQGRKSAKVLRILIKE